MNRQRQASRRRPIPPDNPFLELLFAAMCRCLFVLPGETFVDQVRRWSDAWSFAVSLKPRNPQEWVRAADVTMKQFSAIHCLIMRKRRGITQQQRAQHGQDFLVHAKEMQDARLRYDLLRKSRVR